MYVYIYIYIHTGEWKPCRRRGEIQGLNNNNYYKEDLLLGGLYIIT